MAEEKKRSFWGRLTGRRETAEPVPPQDTEGLPDEDTSDEDTSDEDTSVEEIAVEEIAEGTRAVDTATSPEDAATDTGAPDDIGAPEPAALPEAGVADTPSGWFGRLKRGLGKSSQALTGSITGLFTKAKLDATSLQDLEDILIQADLGVETAMNVVEGLSKERYRRGIAIEDLQGVLAAEVERVLAPLAVPLEIDPAKRPFIVLVVGVNGTGKTTTIGKIAAKLRREGRRVTLAAGDTFRAAAVEQLRIWGERTGAEVVTAEQGADAAGLVFDAIDRARRNGSDVLLVDTAGRLQNRAELMAELEKVVRVIRRRDETAPHAVLLTLDATTGQNALSQVDIFKRTAGVTGLVMTKLDGTARGGILVAIGARHKLPIHFVGVGEKVDDLAPFDAGEFARAIAGLG